MENKNNDNADLREMRAIIAQAEGIGPYLVGHLLKNKSNKYTKKDGTQSIYKTTPILQYRAGSGKRRSKRIPWKRVPEIERLLKAGEHFHELMERHQALAAKVALNSKKKT